MTRTDVSETPAAETHARHNPLTRILDRLTPLDLPEKEHFEEYLRFKWRANHSIKTISSSFTSIVFFLDFYKSQGKQELKGIARSDLEAFVEHEQDRGMHISTVKTRMACIIAFLHWLLDQDLIPATVFKKRIRFKLPETLPRAMLPQDVKKMLSVIDHTRDRALIFLLLRTGMRIGEALALTMNDIDLKERKVHIYKGEKNDIGRVVYSATTLLSVCDAGSGTEIPRRSSSSMARARRPSATALPATASSSISRRQVSITRAIRSTVSDIPLPRSFLMPACAWKSSSSSLAIRTSR